MKFAVAVLLAVFAVCAQSSAVLPYAAWPYASAYSTAAIHAAPYVQAPITQYSSYAHHASPISYAAHVAAPSVYAGHYAAPVAYSAVAAPSWYNAPAVYHAPAVIAKPAATYTAATRGAVHTAPLEGHALSQTSLNVAPAPGTW